MIIRSDVKFISPLIISICGLLFYTSSSIAILQNLTFNIRNGLVFFSTLLIYQLNTSYQPTLSKVKSLKKLLFFLKSSPLITALILIILIHIPFINPQSFLFLAFLGILSVLYGIQRGNEKSSILPLRIIPFIKVFLIAFVWASMSTILPVLINEVKVSHFLITKTFAAHFMFILAITLPFDIRDMVKDSDNQIKTIPSLIGIKWTKVVAITSLVIFSVLIHEHIYLNYLLIFMFITSILILFSSPNRKWYYYQVYLDGTIILYFLAVYFS